LYLSNVVKEVQNVIPSGVGLGGFLRIKIWINIVQRKAKKSDWEGYARFCSWWKWGTNFSSTYVVSGRQLLMGMGHKS